MVITLKCISKIVLYADWVHITEDSDQYAHDNKFSGSVKERGIFYWHAPARAHWRNEVNQRFDIISYFCFECRNSDDHEHLADLVTLTLQIAFIRYFIESRQDAGYLGLFRSFLQFI